MRITYRAMPGYAGAFAPARRKQAWGRASTGKPTEAARLKEWEAEGGSLARKPVDA